MPLIEIQYDPPSHGWLTLRLVVDDHAIEIDAADMPNNPLQELIVALEVAASGVKSSVWWHLEPGCYFTNFIPVENKVQFSVARDPNCDTYPAVTIATVIGSKKEVLLPFVRFLLDFQSNSYEESRWPCVDFSRLQVIKERIETTL